MESAPSALAALTRMALTRMALTRMALTGSILLWSALAPTVLVLVEVGLVSRDIKQLYVSTGCWFAFVLVLLLAGVLERAPVAELFRGSNRN